MSGPATMSRSAAARSSADEGIACVLDHRVDTGTAPAPAPHLLTDAEVAQLASPTDGTFHDRWGGVKVRIQNVTSTPQVGGDGGASITDPYGHVVLTGSNLYVGDKLHDQGLLAKTDVCHKGPTYADAATTFTRI